MNLEIGILSTRIPRHESSRRWDMDEDISDNGPQQWRSSTGQSLDLGIHRSGFQGTLESTKMQMHLRIY